MTRSTPPADPASYAAAEAELEEILTALEGEGVDVDQLSDHVQRARQLITWCRAQVASAEIAVTELLADTPPAGGAQAAGQLDEDAVEALSARDPLVDDGSDDDGLPEDAARDDDALADDDPDD